MTNDSSPATTSRWRNRFFIVTFVVATLSWLVFVGWVTWLVFFPIMDWVGRQHAILQEFIGLGIVVAWALFLGFGVGAAAMLADWLAGTRHLPLGDTPGQTHGQHAAWQRPDRS
jgi:hypothetical protein